MPAPSTAAPRPAPKITPLKASRPHSHGPLRSRAGPALLVLAVGAVGVLLVLRAAEDRAINRIWGGLESTPSFSEVFSPEMVTDLPDPARRYFLHAIEPGTPLAASVHLTQTGSIRLGEDWSPFSAEQLLTTSGFAWKADSRVGPVPIMATDYYAQGQGRMRVAALGLVPIVNASGPDLTRSAIGRLGIEYMWLPSAWLPEAGATIDPIDDERFGVAVAVDGETTRLVLRVDSDGRLVENTCLRFGNQAPDGQYQYIPFGGPLDEEATFAGYTIPTRLRMGWWYGTDRYQEEFRFQITSGRYT